MQLSRGEYSEQLDRVPFTTVDDCLSRAEGLVAGLRQLAQRKYPLDVRKGTSLSLRSLGPKLESKVLKAGSKTYFFDIKRDKENRPYLVITESRFQGAGRVRERTRLTVFSEHARAFLDTVQALVEQF